MSEDKKAGDKSSLLGKQMASLMLIGDESQRRASSRIWWKSLTPKEQEQARAEIEEMAERIVTAFSPMMNEIGVAATNVANSFNNIANSFNNIANGINESAIAEHINHMAATINTQQREL